MIQRFLFANLQLNWLCGLQHTNHSPKYYTLNLTIIQIQNIDKSQNHRHTCIYIFLICLYQVGNSGEWLERRDIHVWIKKD